KDPLTGKPLLLPKPIAGSSEFVTALNAGLNKFRAENSDQEPNPDQYGQILQSAIETAHGAGQSEFDRYVATVEKERGHKLTSRELVTERRRYFDNPEAGMATAKEAAREALFSAVLNGGELPRDVMQRISGLGLDPTAELANARRRLIDVGRGLLSETER